MRKKQVCLHSLALCAYEISRRRKIFPRIRIQQQSTYNIRRILNLESVENVRSSNVVEFEFKLRHIPRCHTILTAKRHVKCDIHDMSITLLLN